MTKTKPEKNETIIQPQPRNEHKKNSEYVPSSRKRTIESLKVKVDKWRIEENKRIIEGRPEVDEEKRMHMKYCEHLIKKHDKTYVPRKLVTVTGRERRIDPDITEKMDTLELADPLSSHYLDQPASSTLETFVNKFNK